MAGRRRDSQFSPLTFGQALVAHVRLIVRCRHAGTGFEPDIAELVERHGEATTVIDWAARLRCSACGARDADFVGNGVGGVALAWTQTWTQTPHNGPA